MPPVRTSDGDLVGRAVPFSAADPATALEGDDMAGPIRTGDGDLVGRTALYQVTDGVAQPITGFGVDPDTVGQPGGPAGPLDGNGHLPTDQIPPSLLHTTFEATSEGEMLAEPAQAPSLCVRTDQDPPHIWFLHDDPATDIGNWKDLGGIVSAGDDPSAQIGLAAVNGSAATFLRSDAAPALDQSIAPTWTGAHEFQAAATNDTPSVGVASGNPEFELRRTTADADEKRWNIATDPDQLVLRALNDAGDVADTAWLLTRSGGTISAHSFHVGGDAYLSISTASDIVAFVDLHMSEQKIINLGDPSNARDAANKSYVDNAVAGVGGGGTMGVQSHNTGSVTLAADDPQVQLCDAFGLGSPMQVTLPDAPPTGTLFYIKLAGAADQNVVISNPNATVDGMDSVTLDTLNHAVTVIYDGQHWQIIAAVGR